MLEIQPPPTKQWVSFAAYTNAAAVSRRGTVESQQLSYRDTTFRQLHNLRSPSARAATNTLEIGAESCADAALMVGGWVVNSHFLIIYVYKYIYICVDWFS